MCREYRIIFGSENKIQIGYQIKELWRRKYGLGDTFIVHVAFLAKINLLAAQWSRHTQQNKWNTPEFRLLCIKWEQNHIIYKNSQRYCSYFPRKSVRYVRGTEFYIFTLVSKVVK